MEIIEDRQVKCLTNIASQLPVTTLYDVIGERMVADAIFDRRVHTLYLKELTGRSLRKKSRIVNIPDSLNQDPQDSSL